MVHHNNNTESHRFIGLKRGESIQHSPPIVSIGHCKLGHFEDRSSLSYEEQESEANHFAKYAMAPNPLIHAFGVSAPFDLYDHFDTSMESAGYTFSAYQKWLNFGPDYYLAYEKRILDHFSDAIP